MSPEQVRKAQEVQQYWTPERIRGAVPVETAGAGVAEKGTQPAPGMRSKRGAEPTHQVAEGIATVGVFLLRGEDGSATPNQFCTASIVTSPAKSLIVTAGHCIKGNTKLRSAAFVPGYRAGAGQAGQVGEMPYGIFPLQDGKVWLDHRYQADPADDDVDFAFLRVGPNTKGQLLEDAAGQGNTLTRVDATHLARESVTVIGYPNGQKSPLACTNETRAFQGRFMEIRCDGYRNGVSGGPFLEDFDGRRGNLVGVIGGYKTGGRFDHTSYISQFDEDAAWLYQQAVADLPLDGRYTMGSAGTWTHGRAMTAGSFHSASVRKGASDLIVRWSDGEVSLYPGNGKYGFGEDVQLAKDPSWNDAVAMTAGVRRCGHQRPAGALGQRQGDPLQGRRRDKQAEERCPAQGTQQHLDPGGADGCRTLRRRQHPQRRRGGAVDQWSRYLVHRRRRRRLPRREPPGRAQHHLAARSRPRRGGLQPRHRESGPLRALVRR
ncbi:trypsin-like serine peptidase [Streptomyces rimosus]|uniref:trypsin-like serine peptidase n=1 Tax=Streptomyces rimosus TaxID=1927 RepID=UPI00378EA544